jgi:hypothetical protein
MFWKRREGGHEDMKLENESILEEGGRDPYIRHYVVSFERGEQKAKTSHCCAVFFLRRSGAGQGHAIFRILRFGRSRRSRAMPLCERLFLRGEEEARPWVHDAFFLGKRQEKSPGHKVGEMLFARREEARTWKLPVAFWKETRRRGHQQVSSAIFFNEDTTAVMRRREERRAERGRVIYAFWNWGWVSIAFVCGVV